MDDTPHLTFPEGHVAFAHWLLAEPSERKSAHTAETVETYMIEPSPSFVVSLATRDL